MSSSITTAPSKQVTKILLTGLKVNVDIPEYFRTLFGTPSEIQSKINADNERVKDAGYDITTYYIDDDDPQTALDWLENKLKEEKFDGIMIGAGLRFVPRQTALFERIINVVRQASPGCVFMFNDGPGGNYEAIMRNKEYLG